MIGKMEINSEVYDEVMSSVDRQLIERALETSGGRIREAARRLGLADGIEVAMRALDGLIAAAHLRAGA